MFYPYSHPQLPHLPDHLVVVSADGFPCFRVEVLDPGEFTKFKMYEILPHAKEWFDFSLTYHRQITDYDFDLGGFKKIMELSLKKNLERLD